MTENGSLTVLRSVIDAAREQELGLLAASIAYYAFVSVIPLVIVGFAVGSALGGEALAQEVLALVDQYLTPEGLDVFEGALVDPEGRGGATVAGLVILTWSGLRLFRGIAIAFSMIYETPRTKSLPGQLWDAAVVLTAIMGGLAVTTAVGAWFPLADLPARGFLGTLGMALLLPVLFFPLYYVFPGPDVSVREAIPGAILAGGGWTLLATAFGIYATYASTYQLYGILGAVLLVLTWFYFGGLLVVLGVVLNAVLADRFEDRQVQQGPPPAFAQQMSDGDADAATDGGENVDDVDTIDSRSVDPAELEALRSDLRDLEDAVEQRTVHREEVESDLRQYVRRKISRGHARGWGPYLVLLYGTIMTLGAFYYLDGGWAVAAMIVIWLSTLGLFTLMIIVGLGLSVSGLPRRAVTKLRNLR